jgi:pyruvate/2-oxoglutarate dehydrogenase complex dihydrolipoamide dehydrogenase (E3) component/uncharacterized membrane protein YdjX (TVP38/TMEM64 family)
MKKIIITLLFLILGSSLVVIFPHLPQNLGQLRELLPSWQSFLSERPYESKIYFGLIYVAVTALSIPGAALLTLAAGALFGLWWGVLIVSFASTAGAAISFLLAREFFGAYINRKYSESLKAVNEGLRRDGVIYVLFLRLVPAFPFVLVNLLLALTSVRFVVFVLASQLGMLPATFLFVAAGQELSKLTSVSDVLSLRAFLVLAALGFVPLCFRFVAQWFARRRLYGKWPKPKTYDYDLVILGGGSAGLVSAQVGTTLRARVALIESHKMGGDCLNTGCVPSKTLIRIAKDVAAAKKGARWLLGEFSKGEINYSALKEEVSRVVSTIEPHDSMERYRSLGVDCHSGHGFVRSPFEVVVNEKILRTRNIIISSGARPRTPQIEGLGDVPFCTSDTLWDLERLPRRLLILGGGAIGCEIGQAMQRLGSQVVIVDRGAKPLAREDNEGAEVIRAVLEREGVTFISQVVIERAQKREQGGALLVSTPSGMQTLEFDLLFLAAGREPRLGGMGLDELALLTEGRLEVDQNLATRFPNIYACGDVIGPFQFTHAAAHQAWHAAVNALARPWKQFPVDYRFLPWVTFTDPELARIGYTETEAEAKSVKYEVFTFPMVRSDRAQTEGATDGFTKILCAKGSDRIIGATIVGSRAGEMIGEVALAMRNGLGMKAILRTVHPYPTYSEALRFAAGDWQRKHAPLWLLPWSERYFRWRRG